VELETRFRKVRSCGRRFLHNSASGRDLRDGEKGIFATFFRISRLPIPLPFEILTARRSVLGIHNLNLAIHTALNNSCARGETFTVSDPRPVTAAELAHPSSRQFGPIILATADAQTMA
jgi:hypothetical protein